MAKTIHIAVISIPAFSHQSSIIEFCKKLLNLNNHFHFTCIFPTNDAPLPATLKLLNTPPNIEFIFLPPINKQDLPQNLPPAVQIQTAVSKSMSSFHNVLKSLSSTKPLVALISDPFANEALEIVKKDFNNLSSYIYFPPSTMTLSLFMHLPSLHNQISSEYRDHEKAIQFPGCIPINGQDLPEHLQDRSSLAYELILQRCKTFSLAKGFLVNSFFKMEEETVRALEEQNKNVPVYLVGPIIQTGNKNNTETKDSECLRWLEEQKRNSVLYVSFGSGGTISKEQLNELAFGLEMSGGKFLWVLRAPSDSANAAYLNGGAKSNNSGANSSNDDVLKFLPNGFLERTKEQGLVIVSWAPQIEILSHDSIGGFLTHCGWNSVLESIVLGVPMIAWPLFAEQKMNAVLLTDGLKVAIRPEINENGLVERREIAKVIRGLMVCGEENGIRKRIEELKDSAVDALKDDGSSTTALYQFGTRLESFVTQH